MPWELVSATVSILLAAALALAVAAGIVRWAQMKLPAQDLRLGQIDGLRGLLALMVLLNHYAIWVHFDHGAGWSESNQAFFANLGPTGVSLFFMISAALFYDRVTQKMSLPKWKALYISRLFRIVPLYWFAVGAALMIFALQGHRFEAADAQRLVKWFSFYDTPALMGEPTTSIPLNVIWTLRTEWLLYASLPLIALAGLAIRGQVGRFSLLASGVVLSLVAVEIVGRIGIIVAMPFFLFGMMAVELKRVPRIQRLLSSWAFGSVGVGALLLNLAVEWRDYSPAFGTLSLVLLGLTFASFYFGNPLLSVFRTRPLVALGEWSFGIYLLHNLLLYVVFVAFGLKEITPTIAWLGLPAATLGVILVAAAAHVLVEQPFIRLGRRWSRGREGDIAGLRAQGA